MDFEYAPEQEAFRKEFRGWLAANLPKDLRVDDPVDDRVASTREMFERRVAFQKAMHKAGWVGIAWPKEYGGRPGSLIRRGSRGRGGCGPAARPRAPRGGHPPGAAARLP